jgi:hypothetical protein
VSIPDSSSRTEPQWFIDNPDNPKAVMRAKTQHLLSQKIDMIGRRIPSEPPPATPIQVAIAQLVEAGMDPADAKTEAARIVVMEQRQSVPSAAAAHDPQTAIPGVPGEINIEALLDSRAFLSAMDGVDPTDQVAVRGAIDAAVTANPRLAELLPAEVQQPGMKPNPAQGSSALPIVEAPKSPAQMMRDKVQQTLNAPPNAGVRR